ncbi:hypothetical protein [Planotetraspora kaengkrachanensis]|uniref:Uncharacterized protein n=1 Tax=Planotetraspora kaengkrachanensis TaxID=575193 RepID=A0A8J3LUG8_9ACTN|nr:hypothetical protein [Planotetraspora kaengkrachanensis]GIG79358.1 hypothetical protein Pka01_24850 [Planotetraspora kaengkrachanensis]
MNQYVDVDALWKVLVAGLAGGVGLVALFAVGLVGLSMRTSEHAASRTGAAGLAVALVCFTLVVAGAALGLYVMLKK